MLSPSRTPRHRHAAFRLVGFGLWVQGMRLCLDFTGVVFAAVVVVVAAAAAAAKWS